MLKHGRQIVAVRNCELCVVQSSRMFLTSSHENSLNYSFLVVGAMLSNLRMYSFRPFFFVQLLNILPSSSHTWTMLLCGRDAVFRAGV